MKYFAFIILLFFVACEDQEQNALNRAQECLDTAPATEANLCKYFVIGLNTPEAYAIRCAADFLSEGLTASKMAESLNNKDKTNTSKNSLLGMMGTLSFRTMTLANTAYSECGLCGISSYFMFASMAKMATKITSVAGITVTQDSKPTQEEMQDALAVIIANDVTEDKELIGEIAVSVNQDYCADPEKAKEKICLDIGEAISNGVDNESIGEQILNILDQQGHLSSSSFFSVE